MSEKNTTAFLSVDEVVFVAYLPSDDSVLKDRFEKIAKLYWDRFSFAVSETSQPRALVVCRNNDNGVERKMTDFTTVDALQTFVKQCSTPLIPELTRRNELEYSSVSALKLLTLAGTY